MFDNHEQVERSRRLRGTPTVAAGDRGNAKVDRCEVVPGAPLVSTRADYELWHAACPRSLPVSMAGLSVRAAA
jgi:hypothetical protein